MNNKGNGSISIIISMMFIILFIVLPLTSMVFENYYVSIVSREIIDASYSSMSSTFDSINISRSTKDKLDYDLDIEARFKEFLKYNLVLNESMQSQNEKFQNLEIVNFSNMHRGTVDKMSGLTMNRQSIHLEMRVEFEPMFLMSRVGEKKTVDIHFDYEVPIDN